VPSFSSDKGPPQRSQFIRAIYGIADSVDKLRMRDEKGTAISSVVHHSLERLNGRIGHPEPVEWRLLGYNSRGIMPLAMKLKRIRQAKGLTQVALAKKVKMPQPYLARLESGAETNPKLDALRRLAKALRCKVSELVD
jgi:DNA-binding Xre family transcriptional regulator